MVLINLPISVMRSLSGATLALSALTFGSGVAPAQDNILVYGNSILDDSYAGYVSDLIVESGQPAPNLVKFIVANGTTTTFLNNSGLITNSLPSGETWDAMIIQGGTIETTFVLGNDPQVFLANMNSLANIYYAHSPQGLFVGHQTGADNENSNNYPTFFPDPETWLSFPVRAYAAAKQQIDLAHPNNPPVRVAPQGVAMAETAGYAPALFESDFHHLSDQGEAWAACLHFLQLYGGRICDIQPDFNGNSPLVQRLLSDNIDEAKWNRIAGWADASQPRALRQYPGSDDDFQMRSAINATITHLCPDLTAAVGDTLNIRLVSPLGAYDNDAAGVYMQVLPTGIQPNGGAFPRLILDHTQMTTWWAVPDLSGGVVPFTIPANLSGMTIWIQAVSRGASNTPGYPLTLSDAQAVSIL